MYDNNRLKESYSVSKRQNSLELNIRINFTTILLLVLALHTLLLISYKYNQEPPSKMAELETNKKNPLIIKNIRTAGAKNSKSHNSVYFAESKNKPQNLLNQVQKAKSTSLKNLSFKDLNALSKFSQNKSPSLRPGSIPLNKPKAISGIGLKGNQMRQFVEGSRGGAPAQDSASPGLANSNVAVNLEVPEGVSVNELNKFELMFYGFQRRTAINYINSFYKNLDKFHRSNPHLSFPMTESKQVMTGRLTYDEKGNIKQIKMIRWSNVDKLQDFFLDVLKDMDTLHNPPQALWKSTGEFSIYFSLIVNG